MYNKKLGCLNLTGIIAAIIVLILISGVSLVKGGTLFSPGKLNAQTGELVLGNVRSHAEISACKDCHVAPWNPQTMSDRCMDCHMNIREDGKDFHQIMLAEGDQLTCLECHTDHHGAKASLLIADLGDFPHNKMGFSLHSHLNKADGTSFACSDCHSGKFTNYDQNTCIECHQSIDAAFMQDHEVAFSGNCLNCHDGGETYGSAFDHTKALFTLGGKHASLACQDCHQGVQTISDLKATAQDCTSCHLKDDPHAGRFGIDCGSCHTAEGWSPAKFDHNLANFKLTGKHVQVDCEKCHVDRKYAGIPQDCATCHVKDDIHEGKLGQDCARCHTSEDWKPSIFDHSSSIFQLAGEHLGVACEGCHTDKFFKGTPQDCTSCHLKDDAHQGMFGANCGECHSPQGWKVISFDHTLTAYPLVGKHGSVACLSCHKSGPAQNTPTACVACHVKDDRHGGLFGSDCGLCHTPQGWNQITFDHSKAAFQLSGAHLQVNCQVCHSDGKFKGTPASCYACHKADDNHNGQFGTDCETCHSTNSWRGATFDHSRSSFKLTGAHAQAACSQCHGGGKFKGTPTACVACHAEPGFHQGLLGTDCGACHNTSGWRPASFNGSHSFPMGHGNAGSCSTCHPNSLSSWTCYSCHNQNEIANKHQGEGIGDFSNCLNCHADGGKHEGGGGDD